MTKGSTTIPIQCLEELKQVIEDLRFRILSQFNSADLGEEERKKLIKNAAIAIDRLGLLLKGKDYQSWEVMEHGKLREYADITGDELLNERKLNAH